MPEKPCRKPNKKIKLEVEYISLTPEEEDERIERLTRKILRMLENLDPNSYSFQDDDDSVKNLMNGSLEKSIGI